MWFGKQRGIEDSKTLDFEPSGGLVTAALNSTIVDPLKIAGSALSVPGENATNIALGSSESKLRSTIVDPRKIGVSVSVPRKNAAGSSVVFENEDKMERGDVVPSKTEPDTSAERGESSAQPPDGGHPPDTTGVTTSSEALRHKKAVLQQAKPKSGTPPHDEKADPDPSPEQGQESPAIKQLGAIVAELRQIKDKTGESDWDFFFKNIGTVASLGASITFALIVTDIKDPRLVSRHGWIDLSTVRIMLATSWILFMAVLSLSFSFGQRLKNHNSGSMPFLTVYILELAAVMCLSFVVAAYVEVVGYVGIALVSIAVMLVLVEAATWPLPEESKERSRHPSKERSRRSDALEEKKIRRGGTPTTPTLPGVSVTYDQSGTH
ncbi:hypothetical protein, variant [Cladophialophora immunda]|uniref:Uncharacterized protein n=1 Tax=Cladophialophora immunda TaxID=569365 RepID=A0A0D2C292_9EURO|nr:hypothetical protein, variant [Cladophialophora immunda]KIW24530.1 hypothetical protein, variant [Cladophialophora immunda]